MADQSDGGAEAQKHLKVIKVCTERTTQPFKAVVWCNRGQCQRTAISRINSLLQAKGERRPIAY